MGAAEVVNEESDLRQRSKGGSDVSDCKLEKSVILTKATGILAEDELAPDHKTVEELMRIDDETTPEYPMKLAWRNIWIFIFLHSCLIYGLYRIVTLSISVRDFSVLHLYSMVINLGVTAGAHRLWTHRSYKAKLPLRVILLFLNTLAVQTSVYEWVRDHRVHHKFTETNADPHNIKRGFFFAHMGWLCCKKHPEVKEKGKLVDMSDIENDPMLMWQHRNYPLLAFLAICVFPPLYFKTCFDTDESWWVAFVAGSCARYTIVLHCTWMVNSYAHIWGNKPYDKYMNASESKFVSFWALGEGFHNYHHVFPWDYKTSELGFYRWNVTTGFIDLFSKIGWAYDLKLVPQEAVKKRVLKTGDGSHHVWGWGDKDIPREFIDVTVRINKKI